MHGAWRSLLIRSHQALSFPPTKSVGARLHVAGHTCLATRLNHYEYPLFDAASVVASYPGSHPPREPGYEATSVEDFKVPLIFVGACVFLLFLAAASPEEW